MDLTTTTPEETAQAAPPKKKVPNKQKRRWTEHARAVRGLKRSARKKGIPLKTFMRDSSHPAAKVWFENKKAA